MALGWHDVLALLDVFIVMLLIVRLESGVVREHRDSIRVLMSSLVIVLSFKSGLSRFKTRVRLVSKMRG